MSQRRIVLSTTLACNFLLASSVALGGSIIGDEYTATISEGGMIIGSSTTTAMIGDEVSPATNVIVQWLDENTFEFDFFGYEDITLELTGLDFMDGGMPVDIASVDEANAEFGWDYNLSFDAHSIMVEYPSLQGPAIGDGEIISFDVTTVPEPISWTLWGWATAALLVHQRLKRRRCN